MSRDPVAPGQDDYPGVTEALAGAIAWSQTLTPSEGIYEIRFGQRNPETVGPDRYYWTADIRATVHCGVYDQDRQDPGSRLRTVVDAWRHAYFPDPDPDPF